MGFTDAVTAQADANWARNRARRERRSPPMLTGPAGACRMCHGPLPPRRRSWCGEGCVELRWVSTDPERARRHLVAVFGWRCWSCGTPTRVLDVDHVRPLWSLSDDERREYRWWLPFNLQLLCTPCHTMKTSHEAAARAHFRRTGVLRLDLFATAPTALELA